jgi:hypothetical protein
MRISAVSSSLTPCSRVPLGKLVVAQLVNKFPDFYETRKFIIIFFLNLKLLIIFNEKL